MLVNSYRNPSIRTNALKSGYHERGYVLCESLFSIAEMNAVGASIDADQSNRAGVAVKEKGGEAVRSVYGSHSSNPLLMRLVSDARLAETARDLLGDEVYLYQFKVNMKVPFIGDAWPWHQDYAFWGNLDSMPSPNAVSVTIYLDDVNEFNGPMFCIPGAHKLGLLPCEGSDLARVDEDAVVMADLSSSLRFTIKPEVVKNLVEENGIVTAKAAKGSAFFFHSNLPHASGMNLSPFKRRQIFITYNSLRNKLPTKSKRPEYLVNAIPEIIVPQNFCLGS